MAKVGTYVSLLYQKLRRHERQYFGVKQNDPEELVSEWFDREPRNRNDNQEGDRNIFQVRKLCTLLQMDARNRLCREEIEQEIGTIDELQVGSIDPKEDDADKPVLYTGAQEEHKVTTQTLIKGETAIDKMNISRRTQEDLGEKHKYKRNFEFLSSNGSRKTFTGEQGAELVGMKGNKQGNNFKNNGRRNCGPRFSFSNAEDKFVASCSQSSNWEFENNIAKATSKRVTIHMQNMNSTMQLAAKMINLPDTIEELLRIGGNYHLIYTRRVIRTFICYLRSRLVSV